MKKVENLYKKYFDETVAYSDNWKYELLKKVRAKSFGKYKQYVRIAISSVLAIIIVLIGINLYNIHKINQEQEYIKSVLLSDSAIYFVMYKNIGLLIEIYYLQSYNTTTDTTELKENIKDSISLYYYIAKHNNSELKDMEITASLLDEVADNLVDYFKNNFQEGIL